MRARAARDLGAVCLALACWGCAAWPDEPPEHFSISDEFAPAERDVIRAAVGEWCEATGHCPAEVLWSERGRFEMVDTIDHGCNTDTCQVPAYNDTDVIRVARSRREAGDMARLYTIVSHEWGHFCAPHTADGLMRANIAGPWPIMIDTAAVDAWHAGCPGF